MTTTTTRRPTGEPSAPADGDVLDERQGFPGRGRSAHLGAARVRPVPRHAGRLDRQRGASVDPGRPRARRCRRHVGRERVRRRVRRPAAAVRTPGRPVRPTRHVHSGLGPVHRRHAAGSRGRGPGAAVGGPRRPGRRRRRAQSCRDVTAHAGLPRSSTSQGHEHLGRRLDAGRSHGRRARRTARRLPGMEVGVPRDRAGVRGRRRPGPTRPSRERSRASAPVRLGRCRFHHRSGRRPGARRPVRGRPGMDGPTRHREPCRRRSADGELRDRRASDR